MALWNKLKEELDQAGRIAREAIDEGRVRLDLMRARSAADKAAQSLGYAVYRAKSAGADLPGDDYERYASELRSADAEATRYETLLREATDRRRAASSAPPPPDGGASQATPGEG